MQFYWLSLGITINQLEALRIKLNPQKSPFSKKILIVRKIEKIKSPSVERLVLIKKRIEIYYFAKYRLR